MHAGLLDRWSREGATLGGLLAARAGIDVLPRRLPDASTALASRPIIEKPGAGNEPSDLVNLVAHVFASTRTADRTQSSARPAQPGADDAYERALTSLMADDRVPRAASTKDAGRR